ncbi:MAG: biotin/lipoyl-containing protein [Prevotella sp.]|nr:biotin/lipoyl-binding protein [Prevotella sp.]
MNKYQYKVQGVDYNVEIEEVSGNLAKVNVNGIPFEVELQQPINAAQAITRPKVSAPKSAPAAAPAAAPSVAAPAAAPVAGNGTSVKSPLPGTITAVNVKVGDKVNNGDTVVVLEAMKMQNNIEAETTGTITSVAVSAGDSVMEGSVLVTIG